MNISLQTNVIKQETRELFIMSVASSIRIIQNKHFLGKDNFGDRVVQRSGQIIRNHNVTVIFKYYISNVRFMKSTERVFSTGKNT